MLKKFKLYQILLPIAAFVAVFALLFFYIFPSIMSSFDNFSKLSTYDKNISIYKNNVNKLKLFSTTDLDNKTNDLAKKIPLGGDVANLVNNVISLANSLGLDAQQQVNANKDNNNDQQAVGVEQLASGDIENIPQSILINGSVYPINLTLIVKGDKNTILSFIQKLNQQDRVLSVTDISLSTANSISSASLTINSYAVINQDSTSTTRKITDPKDSRLLSTPQNINTNLN